MYIAGGDSQTYVVDMESATTASTTWSNSANENRIIPDDREPSSHASSPAESPSSENAPSEILRLRQSPEARALIHIVERYTPFVLILFIKVIIYKLLYNIQGIKTFSVELHRIITNVYMPQVTTTIFD